MKYDISVIIPIYNVPEKFLKKCIDSVLNQTKKDLEIILVDDGSTDNFCFNVCEQYAIIDNRIKIIHQKNKGLSGARNTGVRNATAKWITFVDGDDWIEEECLEEAYQNAEKTDVDIFMWSIVRDFNGRLSYYSYDKYLISNKIYKDLDIRYLKELLLHYNALISTSYSKLIKRSLLIEKHIFHDEYVKQGAEDLEFNFRLFSNINSAVFINKNWYHYVYNKNSISAFTTISNTRHTIECMKKVNDNILPNETNLKKWFNNRMKYIIVTTFISGILHPYNTMPKNEKKKYINQFLNIDIVKESLKDKRYDEIDLKRKIILFLISMRCYFVIGMIAKIRLKEKNKI